MPLTPLYDITDHALLGGKYLKSEPPEQVAVQIMAELLLNLRIPVYTGTDAEELGYAIVRQINFILEHGVTPDIMKSVNQQQPGTTVTYRDRYLDPGAAAIVARVTRTATVGFSPMTRGT